MKGTFHNPLNGLLHKIFNNRMTTAVFSVLTAVVIWFVISIAIYPTTPRTISHVKLNVDIAGSSVEENGLSVIDSSVQEVTVQIEGDRSQIGTIKPEDLTASAVLENITTAGTKTLSIAVTSNNGISFNVKSIKPSTVNVKFDKIATYTFDVVPQIPNVTFADGCIVDEADMVTTPSTVEVTGPVQQLDQVAKCVAQTDQKLQLSASTNLLSDQLLFYNEKGALLDDSDFTYDDIRYSMEIPVLYQKTLDVTYQITNAPSSFDQSSLDLKLSLDQITLAAPNDSLGDMKEFNIGSVSLSEIGLDFSKDFKLEMPEGFTNESGVNAVTLSLDSTGLVKKDFVISKIGLINAPSSYDLRVLTQQLTVSVIGPADEVKNLDATDITVNVDLLSYSVQADAVKGNTVSFNYVPTISFQNHPTVWAVGDYKVAITGTYTGSNSASTTAAASTTTTP